MARKHRCVFVATGVTKRGSIRGMLKVQMRCACGKERWDDKPE